LIDFENTTEEQLILDGTLLVNNKSISYYNRYIYNLKLTVNCETNHSRESLKNGQYLCNDCQNENKKGKEKKKYNLFGREVTLARIIVTINKLLRLSPNLLFVPKYGIPSFQGRDGMEKLHLTDFVLQPIDDSQKELESTNDQMEEVIDSEIIVHQTVGESIRTLHEEETTNISIQSTPLFVDESRNLFEGTSNELFDEHDTSSLNDKNLNQNSNTAIQNLNVKKRKKTHGTTEKQFKETKEILEVWRKNQEILEETKWRINTLPEKLKEWKNKCK
jgi:hypothetical protein